MENIIIGKRIKLGQIVLGFFTAFAFVWDFFVPENKLPAGLVMVVAQAFTGLGQMIVVNKFGVTPEA